MIQVDFDRLAEHVMATFLKPKACEVIQVSGEARSLALLRSLAVAIARAGAFPELRLTDLELTNRILREAPEEFLELTPAHRLRWGRDFDAYLGVYPELGHRAHEGVSIERLRKSADANRPLREDSARRLVNGKFRWVTMYDPSPAEAALLGLPFEDFHDLIFRAQLADYQAIGRLEDRLVEEIAGRDRVHITSAKGTDLTFRIGGRSIYSLSGELRLCDNTRHPNMAFNVPEGEITVAPIETTAEGRAVFDLVVLDGRPIRDLALTFHQGRLTGAAAADGDLAPFHRLLDSATGDKDRIGEWGIGTNPAITFISGDDGLDEKMRGTIHLALGDNGDYGPGTQNRASLHKDFIMQRPSVTVDDRPFLDEGRFVAVEG